MLFAYRSPSTDNSIKQQCEALKQFELTHFAEYDVDQLIANRSQFYDNLLQDLWQQYELNQEDMALLAVGGYGRQEMFPLSDLDILFLCAQPITPLVEQKISQFLQSLWDANLNLGHAVRTLEDCKQQAKDISVATNLLEARFLCGNTSLFQLLNQQLQQDDFWSMADFFQAKISEKKQRYLRYHNTAYNLEPDIKYSPGGLRDLHLLYWLALKHNGAKNLAQLWQTGFINQEEYVRLSHSQQFLFRLRFALHLLLKHYDNRLLFERQLKVAAMLGYGEDNQGVERMMKVFFQSLQTIALLSELLVKYYDEHFLQPLSAKNSNIQKLDTNFYQQQQRIYVTEADIFIRQPDLLLDLFYHLTQYPQLEISSTTLRQLYSSLPKLQGYLSDLPLAREKFLRLFNQPNAIQRAFVPMHQYGVLSAYLAEWKGIEGLMQFDLFHIYTVDEHSLRVMLKLESFLHPDSQNEHPICASLFPQIDDRALLYIVALFHDIAKGRGGDHAELGAQDIVRFAQKHGFEQREIATMQWLVQQHLLMSVTAQRRDIHDPKVVQTFAAEVKNKVRLDYLICLTVADICATNETLWNSWKKSLFDTLYQYSLQQLQQGTENLLNNQEKAESHRQQALSLLSADLSKERCEQLWQRCPAEYFVRNNPKQIAWHTQLLCQQEQELLVKISNRFVQGGTEIFLYCKDQPNLFYKVVSAIGAKKFSIHDAQIITSLDGYVFDSFIITEPDGSLVRAERRRLLEQTLTQTLQTDKPIFLPRANHKLQHFKVKTEVRFLNEQQNEQTEMELFALDKVGLLAEVSRIFSELNLNLSNAKITTIGEKAEDFFILTNAQNVALNASERQQLQTRIEQEI